jgi:hypothetical protein
MSIRVHRFISIDELLALVPEVSQSDIDAAESAGEITVITQHVDGARLIHAKDLGAWLTRIEKRHTLRLHHDI